MKRLLCRLLGHQWRSGWHYWAPGHGMATRACRRCDAIHPDHWNSAGWKVKR